MKNRPPIGSTIRARNLRRNPTQAEKLIWRLLRENFPEARFRRQVPIRQYITDFASHRVRIIIEVDGGQHNEEFDAARTAIIQDEGYRVLRFWNNDVLGNSGGVLAAIAEALHGVHPHQPPPSRGRH